MVFGLRRQIVHRYVTCLTSECEQFLPFVYMQDMCNGGCVHSSAGFNLAERTFDMFTH